MDSIKAMKDVDSLVAMACECDGDDECDANCESKIKGESIKSFIVATELFRILDECQSLVGNVSETSVEIRIKMAMAMEIVDLHLNRGRYEKDKEV